MSLYDAVKLASGQRPARLSASLSRLGDEYYLFGAPGSSACAVAAKAARFARRSVHRRRQPRSASGAAPSSRLSALASDRSWPAFSQRLLGLTK